MSLSNRQNALDLTVVIPSFNSATWLPSTIDALRDAVLNARIAVEVLVIDDGSVDDTVAVVAAMAADFPGDLTVVSQENRGRFLARWTGIERAQADLVLLLDSRVLVEPHSLVYVMDRISENAELVAWNAHVHIDPTAPLVGHFWEVPTHVFWGDYLRSPRAFDLTQENFDSAPKGTTAFLARRDLLSAAFQHAWPEGDAKLMSDDTKILRWIASTSGIRLDPGFAVVYRPRTTVSGFVRHSFDRGTMFVDSYAGTSPLRSGVILLAALAPVALLVLLGSLLVFGAWIAVAIVIVSIILVLALPIVPAVLNRCPRRGLQAYCCVLPIFIAPFWAGLVRGIGLHRRAFMGRVSTSRKTTGRTQP